jgi:hypothetical protein
MLTHPPLIDANPGDPITSEGWNNLVQSIKTLYDALNKPQGTLVFKVTDKADSAPVENAVVSLFRKDGTLVRSAAFVGGALNAYVAFGVPLGSYGVVVEADDYAVENRDLEVGEASATAAQETAIQMTRTSLKTRMPNLFGFTVAEAQITLGNSALLVGRILDSHGNDIPPAAVPAELITARVLNQVPEAGALVEPKDPVQLHISAKVEVKLPVKVPKLLGMTYAEATAALEAVGLKIAAPISGTK